MTRSEFLTYIKRTFKREDKDTELLDSLTDTLYDMTTLYDFQVYQTETEFSMIDNQYEYTYPSNYAILISDVRYIDSGGGGRSLRKLSKEEFDNRYPDLKESTFPTGDPLHFTIYNDNIVIAPFPNDATNRKLYICGSTIQEELASDSSTTNFQDRWREIIKYGTLYRAYTDMEDFSKASIFANLYKERLQNMIDNDKIKDNGLDAMQLNII